MNEVKGKTDGVKRHILDELAAVYDMRVPRGRFATMELLSAMAAASCAVNREVSVFLDRSGMVRDVSIGEADNVTLPYLRVKRGLEVLSGVRCIHTHLGPSNLSDVDYGTLKSSRLDAMAAVSVSGGEPRRLTAAIFGDDFDDIITLGPFPAYRIPAELMTAVFEADRRIKEYLAVKRTKNDTESAILIGVNSPPGSIEELTRLCETAGARVIAARVQKRMAPDKRTYIGSGEAKELSLLVSAENADMIVADDELSAATVAELEELTGVKVIDRTALILDIFASRAATREAKLQVELAQLKYNLPRLRGSRDSLSRLGGGIGTRGPGESKIETDRRVIRRRIFELEQSIAQIDRERIARRSVRRESGVTVIALAGYTNAGKSTLLHAISDADVFIEDKLFATLDTTTRRVTLPSGREALFTDTVGFIEKLPHALVAAFRSTLEEVTGADLILNVIDISDPSHSVHEDVVSDVLSDLGCAEKPILKVYNKCDRIDETPGGTQDAVFISAAEKRGLERLLTLCDELTTPVYEAFDLTAPYSRGDVVSYLTGHAQTIETEYGESGTRLSGRAQRKHIERAEAMLGGNGNG